MEQLIKRRGSKNKGLLHNRIAENKKHKYNDTEEAFINRWNDKVIGESKNLNAMFVNNQLNKRLKITLRDRFVIATIIQWLGSNCGMCFLKESLGKAGYEIVKKK